MAKKNKIIPSERIENAILLVRGEKVLLDRDLAALYGVSTSNLNKAVSRNLERFPDDFMFRLSMEEFENLKFHFGTSSWGGTRKMPRAFTEQGVAMLSSVLKSKRAVAVNDEVLSKGWGQIVTPLLVETVAGPELGLGLNICNIYHISQRPDRNPGFPLSRK